MNRTIAIIIGSAATAVFGICCDDPSASRIRSYFTPTRIEFQDLEGQYAANGSMAYTVSLKGYGSNCIAFEAGIFRDDGPLSQGGARRPL